MKRSYDKFNSWKGFQEYFPEEYRINKDNKPKESYWEWEDYSVHLDRYIPEKDNKKFKIILIHGGGGNGRLLSPLGVALCARGYELIAPDLPGFGLTKIRKANSYYTWIKLLDNLIDKELKNSNKGIILYGLSLGGMLAYQVACINNKVKALIVTSLADTRDKEVQIQLSKTKIIGTFALPMLNKLGTTIDNIRIPIKITTKMWAMANNKSFVRKLLKDRVGSGSWVYLKFLRTLCEANPEIEPENFTRCPLLFIQPEKDYIIPWHISQPFYDRLACKKEFVMLEGCGHIPLEEPGINQLREATIKFIEYLEQ